MSKQDIQPGTGEKASRAGAGFTLIELLVVIAIIATLVGLVLSAITRAPEQGRILKCRALIGQLEQAWDYYLQENREFPSESFSVMDTNAMAPLRSYVDYTREEWGTNSASSGLRDPWGELLSIRLDTDLDGQVSTPYGDVDQYVAIWSKGPDRDEDTGDDIKSWKK